MSNAHRARSNNLTLVQGGLNKMVSSETLQPMGVAALSPPLRNTLAASTAIAAATHQVSLRFRLHFPKVQTPHRRNQVRVRHSALGGLAAAAISFVLLGTALVPATARADIDTGAAGQALTAGTIVTTAATITTAAPMPACSFSRPQPEPSRSITRR